MDYFIYLLAGFAAAFIGALPPGAVNLSVVYTTLNRGASFALPIILTAAMGEIILSYFALHCTMTVQQYIQENVFIQYTIAILLILAGLFLFFKKTDSAQPKTPKKNRGFLNGLLLSVLNPPDIGFLAGGLCLPYSQYQYRADNGPSASGSTFLPRCFYR